MKQDHQPRRPSKEDVPRDKLQPGSDMNERAKGGDKESNEPLHRPKEGGDQPQSSPGRQPGS